MVDFGPPPYSKRQVDVKTAAIVPAPIGPLTLYSRFQVLGLTVGAAMILVPTDRRRQSVTIKNDGTNALKIAEGTLDSLTAPGSGYQDMAVGDMRTILGPNPIFVYAVTASTEVLIYSKVAV